MEVSNIISPVVLIVTAKLYPLKKIPTDADEGFTGSMNLLQQQAFEIGTNLCSGTGGLNTCAGTSGQTSLIGHARLCWTATFRNGPALPDLQPEKIAQKTEEKAPLAGPLVVLRGFSFWISLWPHPSWRRKRTKSELMAIATIWIAIKSSDWKSQSAFVNRS